MFEAYEHFWKALSKNFWCLVMEVHRWRLMFLLQGAPLNWPIYHSFWEIGDRPISTWETDRIHKTKHFVPDFQTFSNFSAKSELAGQDFVKIGDRPENCNWCTTISYNLWIKPALLMSF